MIRYAIANQKVDGAYSNAGSIYGTKILDWNNGLTGSPPQGSVGDFDTLSTDKIDGATKTLRLGKRGGGLGSIYIRDVNTAAQVVLNTKINTIGVWVKNLGTKSMMFTLHLWDSTGARRVKVLGAARVSPDWQFLVCQRNNFSVDSLLVTDTPRWLTVGEETGISSPNSFGTWNDGESLLFGNVYLNPRSRPKFIPRLDDGTAAALVDGGGTGYPGGETRKNYKAILDYYGYKGTLLLVGEWVGQATSQYTFLTKAQIQTLLDAGWCAVNHSYEHPSNGTTVGYGGNGLALLGPKGYYYSQQTTQGYAYGAMADCQVTAATAATDVLTTKAAHNFIAQQRIEFIDLIPPGLQAGVTYYVKTVPSSTTFTLSTNWNLSDTVNITADWADAGGANFRWPGSAPDDSAIYNDIIKGRDALDGLGLVGDTFFGDVLALPQGWWDPYVLSACKRAGIVDIWGTTVPAQGMASITVGDVIGSNNVGSACVMDGSISLTGAIQVDGTPTQTQIDDFVDHCCKVGGTGSCVTHGIGGAVATKYDNMLKHVKDLEKQGVLDVVTYGGWRRGS